MKRANPKSEIRNPISRGRRSRRSATGFTLIEASLTTVIIGTGVLAILAAQQAYHMKNNWATRTSTAMLLANELRERTLSLPLHDPITNNATLGPEIDETVPLAYDDLDDFAGTVTAGIGAGQTFNPPIDALGLSLTDLDAWTQTIKVEKVPADQVDTTFPLRLDTGASDMFRVTVSVLYRNPQTDTDEAVTELSWIVTDTP
ncbi:MAG: type IV pilus modification PilV family protein [Phycisphaeraceae bacterium]